MAEWVKKFTYDSPYGKIIYYGYGRHTLVRTPWKVVNGVKIDEYKIWDANGRTISVQYFDSLTKAKRFTERLLR